VKLMHNRAADSVAPSPRSWGGERVGVRGTRVVWVSAPHPSPLPVRPPRDASVAGTPANGEREQAEHAALLITPHRNAL
jgi:hypothetical protein